MTTFRCSSDILITSWLFTARWSTWPGNHLDPYVAELVGSCCPIYAWWCLPDLKCLSYPPWGDRQEVWSEDQGAQERSGLFHSWYTDPSLQGKGDQCNSQVSHHRPCRGREPRHRLGQDKSGRQRGTATVQMYKRGTLDHEDTDVHESGCRILPTQPHMGPGDFHVTCSIEL